MLDLSLQIEQLIGRVRQEAAEIVSNGEKPGLNELLNALDVILAKEDPKPSTEVANAVYRRLIKTEKKKAYESIVSIQSEIYDLQDQETAELSRSFEQPQRSISADRDQQNFTFAKDSLTYSNSNENRKRKINIQLLDNSVNVDNPYLSDSDYKKGGAVKKSVAFKGKLLPPHLQSKPPMTPQGVGVNFDRRSDNIQTFLYGGPDASSSDNMIQVIPPQPTIEGVLSHSSTFDKRNTKISTNDDSHHHMMFDTTSNSNMHTLNLLSNRTAEANHNMPISMSQHMLIQEKYEHPVKQDLHQHHESDTAVTDTFQILEETIMLQKNRSFNRRCEKLARLQKQLKNAIIVDKNHFSGGMGTIHNAFGQDSDSGLNADLKNDLRTLSAQKTSLPKLVLSGAKEDSSSSSDQYDPYNKAIDSNKAIVTAYYARKLLMKVLQGFETYKEEQNAKTFLKEAVTQNYRRMLLRVHFQQMKKHMKKHKGHYRSKVIADAFFRAKIGKVYFKFWRNQMILSIEHLEKLTLATKTLNSIKKQRLFRSWRTVALEEKMTCLQSQTARHINGQRVAAKVLHALRSYARYTIKTRYLDAKCTTANRQRLIFKGFKTWQRFMLIRAKRLEMQCLADQLRKIALQRSALYQFKQFMIMTEHARSLKECAFAYNELALKKVVYKAILQYSKITKEKNEKRTAVAAYYEANLKLKLFKFFHESNIEFIEHQVQVEQYFGYRRRLRLFFRILQKNAKIQSAQSSFSRLPTSEAIHVVHMWFTDSFGEEQREAKIKLSSRKAGRNRARISMSNIKLQKCLSRKYVTKQTNADVLLHHYYYSRIFSVWKKEYRAYKTLKNKVSGRLLSEVLTVWQRYSLKNRKRNQKVRLIRAQHQQMIYRQIYKAIQLCADYQKNERQNILIVKKRVSKRRVGEAFGKWLSLQTSLEKRRQLKRLSQQMRRKLYFKRFLKVWKAKFDHLMKKRTLQQLKADFIRGTIKRRMFTTWLITMRKRCSLVKRDQMIMTEKKTDTLSKVFYSLKHYAEKKRRQRALANAIDDTRRLAILRKCVSGWREFVPETQSKQLLMDEVGKDHTLKVMQKVFETLKTNRNYRIEKECTDALMTKSVQMVVTKRFFRSWRSLANKRMGLVLISATLKKLQVASLFKRVRYMASFEEEAKSHIGLLREFLVLQKAFKVLDNHAHRKDHLEVRRRQCEKMRTYLCAKQHFRLWRERLDVAIKYEKIACFTVIQMKNEIQAKYFNVLKTRYLHATKCRKVNQLSKAIYKRVAFAALAKVSQRKRLYRQLVDQRTFDRKQNLFTTWLYETRELQIVNSYQTIAKRKSLIKLFDAWQRYCQVEQRRKFLVDQGQANSNFYTTQKILYALSTYSQTQIYNRNAVEQMHSTVRHNRLRLCFDSLLLQLQDTKTKSEKYDEISRKVNRRVALEHLLGWKDASSTRIQQFKACRAFERIVTKMDFRKGFCQLHESVLFLKEAEQACAQFDKRKRVLTLRKVFKALKLRARQRRNQTIHHKSVTEEIQQLRLRRLFSAIVRGTYLIKIARQNKQFADTYRYDRMLRKALSGLVSHAANNRRLRYLLGAALFQRLTPKAFACLKMNTHRQRQKRNHVMQAVMTYELKLKQKGLQAIFMAAVKASQQKAKINRAQQLHHRNLLKRAWSLMEEGVQYMKDHKVRRYCMAKTLLKVDNEVTVKTAFTYFRLGITMQQHDLLMREIQANKLKVARIVTAWQGVMLYQKRVQLNSMQIQITRKRNMERAFFGRWCKALTDNLRVAMVQRRRNDKILALALDQLKLLVYLRKASAYAARWRQEYLKRAFFNQVLIEIDQKQCSKEKIMQMRSVLDTRLKTKVFLGLRYHIICVRGSKLLKQKTDKQLLVKALDALRYYTVSQRVTRRYTEFRLHKMKQAMFQTWHKRFTSCHEQKQALRPILQILCVENKFGAFRTWKRNVFRQKFLEKLQSNMLFPKQVNLAINCLRAWRKHAKFQKNKAYHESEIMLLREENMKRRFFQEWFNSAMQRAPMSLSCIKIERAQRRITMRQGFQKILEQAVRDQDLEQIANNIQESKNSRRINHAYTTWRAQFQQCQFEKFVSQKHQLALVGSAFKQWRGAFQSAMEAKLQEEVQQQAMKSAHAFYNEKLVKQSFSRLVWNLINKRQSNQARNYYKDSLAKKALEHMKRFAILEKENGSLAVKANAFKKTRQTKAITRCYKQWRFQFEQFQREQQIIDTFKAYTSGKLLSVAFEKWHSFTLLRNEIKERNEQIVGHVQQMSRKRLLEQIFRSMKANACNRRDHRMEKQQKKDISLEFRAKGLMRRAYNAWADQCQQKRPQQLDGQDCTRSKMYSVFSAWKFYTKERVLLKKYLFECGESITDMSLMTTVEMRETAARVGSEKEAGSQSQLTQLRGSSGLRSYSREGSSFAANSKSVTDYGSKAQMQSFNGVLDQLNSSNTLLDQSAGLEPRVKNSLIGGNEYGVRFGQLPMDHKALPTATRARSGEKRRSSQERGTSSSTPAMLASAAGTITEEYNASRNKQAFESGNTTQSLLAKQFGTSGKKSL